MFPRADTVGARPVSSLDAAKPTLLTGDARQEVFQRLNRIALGTHFRAEVLSHLKDGAFLVKVAGGAVRMNLPDGAKVGDTVDLTLAATQPRLTFLLGQPRADNTTSLSNTGRFIDRILHTAQDDGAPSAVVGKTPLAPSSDIKPDQLASAMKNALASSGLFYESHVAQWAQGERSLRTLMAEPQAKNSDPKLISAVLRDAAGATPAEAETPETNTAQLMRLAESLQGKPEAAPVLMELLRAAVRSIGHTLPSPGAAPGSEAADTPPAATTLPAADTQSSATGMPAASTDTINSESARMISLQLNALEQQRVAWQGELWPGQPIEWEISEDTPQGQDPASEERVWHSTVRFDMPALGAIAASVQLTGERLRIQVRTADEAAATLLRAHGDLLSSALAAAGSPLELLSVKRDESA